MPFRDPVKKQMKFGYTTIETNNMLRDFAGNATGPYRGKMGLIVTHLEDLSMGVSDRLRLNRDAVRAISEAYNPIIDTVRGYKNPNEQNEEINRLRKMSVNHMLTVISGYAARVTPAYAIDRARISIADNPRGVPGFAPVHADPQMYLADEIKTQRAQVSAFKNDVMDRINPIADSLSDYLVANENANRKGRVTMGTRRNIEYNRGLFLERVAKQIHSDLIGNKEKAAERMRQTADIVFGRAIGALDAGLILDMINIMENPKNATPKQKIDAGLEFIRKFANNINEDVSATRPVSRLEQGALIITGSGAGLTAPVQPGARAIGMADAGQMAKQLPQHTQPGNSIEAWIIEAKGAMESSRLEHMQISSAEVAARKKALEDKIKSTMDKNLNRLSEIDKSINPGGRIDNETAREASILNLLIHIDARLMVAAGIAGREEVSGTVDSLAGKVLAANSRIQSIAKKSTDISVKEVHIDFAPAFRNGEDILNALSEWTAERRTGTDTAAHMKLSDIFDEYSRMAYSSMSGVVGKLPNPERHMEAIRKHMDDFRKELLGVREVSWDAAPIKRDKIDIRYFTMLVGSPLELSREKPKNSSDSQLAATVTPTARKPAEELKNEEALYMGL